MCNVAFSVVGQSWPDLKTEVVSKVIVLHNITLRMLKEQNKERGCTYFQERPDVVGNFCFVFVYYGESSGNNPNSPLYMLNRDFNTAILASSLRLFMLELTI